MKPGAAMRRYASDVIIVGGGLSGTVLALAAARRGRHAVLFDADPSPRHPPYAEILWDPTLRRLDTIGVGETVRREASVRMQGFEVTDRAGGRLLRFDAKAFDQARATAWSTEPTTTRQILLAAARDTGRVTPLLGVTVTRIDRRHPGTPVVIGRTGDGEQVEARAPLVVGADGPWSTVRRQGGFRAPFRPFPYAFAVAQGPAPPGLPAHTARAYLDPAAVPEGVGFAAVAPVPGDRACLVALVPRDPQERRMGDAFHQAITALEPDLADWPSLRAPTVLTRHVGHVDRYTNDGLTLIGDSAHPVSPFGGQGADMAIADALAYDALVVARTPPGKPPPADALNAYARARRPANATALRFTHAGAFVLRTARRIPPATRLMPPVLRMLDRVPGWKPHMLKAESRAFRNLRGRA